MAEPDSYKRGDPQQYNNNNYGYNGGQQYQQYGQQQYGQPQYHQPYQQVHQQESAYGNGHGGGGGYDNNGHHGGYDNSQAMNDHNQPPPAYGPPPPYSFNPPQGNDEKYSFDNAFKLEKPKYNDLWAGILFVLVFLGYVVISVIAIRGYVVISVIAIRGYVTGSSGSGIYRGTNNFSLNSNTIILFACCLVVAFVFSYTYIWLARIFPKQFIWITGILNLVWALGTAIFYLYKRYWAPGIIFLIFALFLCFAFWTWISRIPFSALMLKTSINVSKNYGHVYLVSLIGGLIATALAAWFSVTLVAIYVTYEPSANNPRCGPNGSGCSKNTIIGLVVYVTFAMYWVSEWLKNTIHTIIAGVYGSWYFSPHNFPKDATRSATKRAVTYSFGSICFGSLLVAIIQFLKQVCSIARNQGAEEGGVGGWIAFAIFCVLSCLLSMIEWAVEFINRYAFCHIALYGKAYIDAAKDTWRMVKDRGIDALVNDCLIGPVLSFGALFIGYACALLAYLYLLFTKPEYNKDGGFTPVVMAFSFLIGFQIANVFTTPLSSGIDTIFVAAGWDPQVLINEHPELYGEMVRVYPQVQEAIH